MNEFNFTLTTPVKYAYEGSEQDGNFIVLTEPSIDQLDHVAMFKKAFYQSAEKVSGEDDDSKEKEKKEVTGDQIMALLYSHYPDMKQLFGVAKKLFFSIGIARVEDVTDFTPSIYKTMSINDFERMIGEYLVNFILQSALNQES